MSDTDVRPPVTAMPVGAPAGGPPPGPVPTGRLGFPFGGAPTPHRPGPRNRERMEGAERGGWHRNWVALALSTEVPAGGVIGRDLYGEKVLLARTADGGVSALTAYCRHFGADLTTGSRIAGDCVVCPFHAWRYDLTTGRGRSNVRGEPLPDGADLFAFPVRERYGLVWVFNGPEADREPPGFEGIADDELEVQALQIRTPAYNEPWVQFSNSHDFTHLRYLHGADLLSGPDNFFLGEHGGGHDVVFRMPSGRVYDHVVRVHGTNAIVLHVQVDGDGTFYNMFSAVQADDETMIQTMVLATPRSASPDERMRLLAESAEYGQTLSADDDAVLWNARFVPDITQERDREILLYIDYVRNFPRHDPYSRYRRS